MYLLSLYIRVNAARVAGTGALGQTGSIIDGDWTCRLGMLQWIHILWNDFIFVILPG